MTRSWRCWPQINGAAQELRTGAPVAGKSTLNRLELGRRARRQGDAAD
jgi:hypothetical protein